MWVWSCMFTRKVSPTRCNSRAWTDARLALKHWRRANCAQLEVAGADAAEIGVIGNEGMVRTWLPMGGGTTPSRADVQIAGRGFRLSDADESDWRRWCYRRTRHTYSEVLPSKCSVSASASARVW